MFNSTIFDVVFGLVSVFLAVSLFTSAVTEGLSMLVGLRARTLLSGVKQLLNDPDFDGLARSLYNHALVNPLSDGQTEPGKTPSIKPSYIDPKQFALALVHTLKQAGDAAAKAEGGAAPAVVGAVPPAAGTAPPADGAPPAAVAGPGSGGKGSRADGGRGGSAEAQYRDRNWENGEHAGSGDPHGALS